MNESQDLLGIRVQGPRAESTQGYFNRQGDDLELEYKS